MRKTRQDFCNLRMGEIYTLIPRYLEGTRPQVKGIHILLCVSQGKFRIGKLKNLLRIFRAESQCIASVYNGLAKSESKIDYAIFRLLVTDRIEIDGSSYSRKHRIIQSVMFSTANALHDYSHLLFAEQVCSGLYVCPAAGIEY